MTSLIGRSWSSAFRLSTTAVSMVARGLVLLYGIGTGPPGPIGRNFGKQTNITPGWRSQAASILRAHFGEAPFTLTNEQDGGTLDVLGQGASVYTSDDKNIWKILAAALDEHGSLTITMDRNRITMTPLWFWLECPAWNCGYFVKHKHCCYSHEH